MAKLLLNADGKVLTSNDKVLKAPEGVNVMKTLLDGRKQAKYLFNNYNGTSVDGLISYSDTENITDTSYMFASCSKLQTIPQLDTSNVTNMGYMFQQCFDLQTIPQLDTSKVTRMSAMFDGCAKLQTIDITSLDKISSTSYMSNFANSCCQLTKLIIRNMTVIPPLNSSSFTNCCHFNGTINSNYNPEGLKDGRIYVPDDFVEQLKTATNWSAYADIIVPSSTLQEE